MRCNTYSCHKLFIAAIASSENFCRFCDGVWGCRLDLDVGTLEQQTEEERAQFTIEAERLQLRYQLLLLETPEQQRALDGHVRSIAQAQRLLAAIQVTGAHAALAVQFSRRL